jgi:hypothetical protein
MRPGHNAPDTSDAGKAGTWMIHDLIVAAQFQ